MMGKERLGYLEELDITDTNRFFIARVCKKRMCIIINITFFKFFAIMHITLASSNRRTCSYYNIFYLFLDPWYCNRYNNILVEFVFLIQHFGKYCTNVNGFNVYLKFCMYLIWLSQSQIGFVHKKYLCYHDVRVYQLSF